MKQAALLLVLALAGCITPPAIMKAGESKVWLGEFPPGAELLELPVDAGECLRGVFVPGDAGAPVVLHLLESQGSVTNGTIGFTSYPMLWDLRDAGLASVAVDYRGVGASDGSRSPRHLRADARAAWNEAVRRAGGDPKRVAIRAMSIGTLAAATLLEDGARPGAVVFVAPVRGETVATHYAYEFYADVLAFLVTPFLRVTVDVDIVEVLAAVTSPLLVTAPESDFFLSPDEMGRLEAAVRAAGGRFDRFMEYDHIELVLEAHRVLDGESSLYATLFPGWPSIPTRMAEVLASLAPDDAARFAVGTPERGRLERVVARHRLEPPVLAAVLALGNPPDDAASDRLIVDWLRSLPADRLRALPLDAVAALVDLGDPAGPLDPGELCEMKGLADAVAGSATAGELPERFASMVKEKRFDRFACVRAAEAHGAFHFFSKIVDVRDDPKESWPRRLRLAPRDSMRQAVRLLVKCAAIPDRVVASGDSLEVWESAAWRRLELPALDEAASATGAKR